MKEDWKSLVGKRILLRGKYSTAKIVEATVVEVSKSGEHVKFRWMSGSESWEKPGDEYNFDYDELLEVLGEAEDEKEVKKVEPIYEKLAPSEVLIISKEENGITYATNKEGEIVLKKVHPYSDDYITSNTYYRPL